MNFANFEEISSIRKTENYILVTFTRPKRHPDRVRVIVLPRRKPIGKVESDWKKL